MRATTTARESTFAARTVRHESALGSWESATAMPSAALAGSVRGTYQGFIERRASYGRRREPALDAVAIIINLGPAFHITGPHEPDGGRNLGSFVVGMHDTFAFTEATGPTECLQVDLTPLGAYRLFGLPMSELANRTVDLGDVLGAAAPRLAAQLYDCPHWPGRFARLDHFLCARLAASPPLSPGVAWAWDRLRKTGGRERIDRLAAGIGCSHRHLVAGFRQHLGQPPRLVGRLLRFRRALTLIERQPTLRLAEIAFHCGFSDQAHMNRDFRQFAGCPPGVLQQQALPDQGGIAGGHAPEHDSAR